MNNVNIKYNLPSIQLWAAAQMLRKPDFIIGDDYLRRWWILPRNDYTNLYLHEILASDDDRALHDHPWASTSFIIDGSYIEHLPNGESHIRVAGDVIHRKAEQLHRLEIPEGGKAISLFITGPKERKWGFDCPNGWVHWKDFVGEDTGKIGRGCGED